MWNLSILKLSKWAENKYIWRASFILFEFRLVFFFETFAQMFYIEKSIEKLLLGVLNILKNRIESRTKKKSDQKLESRTKYSEVETNSQQSDKK